MILEFNYCLNVINKNRTIKAIPGPSILTVDFTRSRNWICVQFMPLCFVLPLANDPMDIVAFCSIVPCFRSLAD